MKQQVCLFGWLPSVTIRELLNGVSEQTIENDFQQVVNFQHNNFIGVVAVLVTSSLQWISSVPFRWQTVKSLSKCGNVHDGSCLLLKGSVVSFSQQINLCSITSIRRPEFLATDCIFSSKAKDVCCPLFSHYVAEGRDLYLTPSAMLIYPQNMMPKVFIKTATLMS